MSLNTNLIERLNQIETRIDKLSCDAEAYKREHPEFFKRSFPGDLSYNQLEQLTQSHFESSNRFQNESLKILAEVKTVTDQLHIQSETKEGREISEKVNGIAKKAIRFQKNWKK